MKNWETGSSYIVGLLEKGIDDKNVYQNIWNFSSQATD